MNVKQLMAKALINSGEDYCVKYCVDRQKCNERLREQELNKQAVYFTARKRMHKKHNTVF